MLEIKNYCLSFRQKMIFDNTYFKAANNQLIVIIGESGVGKTTLLNSLALENHFSGIYTYDNMATNRELIQNYFYKLEQFPEILEDLTIENHFKLIDQSFDKLDSFDCLSQLNIKELFHKYPSQLSGGELKRVALALALITNKQILIIDEPTASLNEEYSCVVCELLKKYSESGHIVIASSHDSFMLDYADVIYEIEYNTLNYKKGIDNVLNTKQQLNNTSLNMRLGFKNHIEMYIHSLRRSKIIKIVMIILISISSIGLVFNNTAISAHKDLINSISSTEVLIYKDISGQGLFEYSFSGNEFPLSNEEVQQVNNIEHVSSVNYRFDSLINNYVNEDNSMSLDISNDSIMDKMQVKENSQALQFDIPEDIDEEEIYLKTFNDKVDYSNKIEKQLTSEKGIYISQTLFNILFKNAQFKENLSLYFPIQIPLYNCSGMSWGTSENFDQNYEQNCIASKMEWVELPIMGILNNDSLYDTYGNIDLYEIFIDQDIFENYINANKRTQTKTYYYVKGEEKPYLNEVLDDKEVIQTIVMSPWTPDCYIIYVNDLGYLDDVLSQINDLGLNAKSIYIDSTNLQKSINST